MRRRWYLCQRPTVAVQGGMKIEGGERRYGGNVVEVRMAWRSVVVVVGLLYACDMSG